MAFGRTAGGFWGKISEEDMHEDMIAILGYFWFIMVESGISVLGSSRIGSTSSICI